MFLDPTCQRDDRPDVGEVVVAKVREPEHQRPAIVVRRDDGVATEGDLGGRTRETREQQRAENRKTQQSDQSFQRDEYVGGPGVWHELSVADCRKGLDAEEDALLEACEL